MSDDPEPESPLVFGKFSDYFIRQLGHVRKLRDGAGGTVGAVNDFDVSRFFDTDVTGFSRSLGCRRRR